MKRFRKMAGAVLVGAALLASAPVSAALPVPGDAAPLATIGSAAAAQVGSDPNDPGYMAARDDSGVYAFGAVAEAAGSIGIAVTLTAVAAMVVMSFIGLARGRR